MRRLGQEEKRYNFTIIVTSDGKGGVKKSIQWDPDQGMEGGCHGASDKLLKGQASERMHYDDRDTGPKRPRDFENERRDTRQQIQSTV